MSRKFLLGSGILSSLVYLAMDIVGSMRWHDYSYVDQTVSELAALGAPSRSIALLLGTAYNILLILFAAGVAWSAGSRSLRIAAAALAGIGAAGIAAVFFPIHLRGEPWTINETMHVTLTTVTVVLIVIAMASGAHASGSGFFAYSLISIAVMLLFGALAGSAAPALAEDLPTPWLGVTERLSIFTFLAWLATLAAVLMRVAPLQPRLTNNHQTRLRGHHAGRWHFGR